MRSIIAAIIAGVFLFGGTAFAADLNAPISTTPTLGSEIRRGNEAALDCAGSLSTTENPADFTRCINETQSKNDQKPGETRPFTLGLFFYAWVLERAFLMGEPEGHIAPNLPPRNLAYIKSDENLNFRIFRGEQKELGLTDAQLLSAAEISEVGRKFLPFVMEHWPLPK
jgi:hypothetical protein